MRGHWLVAVLLAASGTAAAETAPEGWFKAGEDPQDYEIGVARNVARSGKASSYLRSSVDEPETFGTLMQMCDAEGFIGKRIQMSGYVKTDGVEGWAGLWFRIDGVNKRPIGFDNMMNRPISGMSDWTRYTIVLDVPTDSNNLAFGGSAKRSRKLWLDDLRFEEVGPEVPTTNLNKSREPRAGMMNLDFED